MGCDQWWEVQSSGLLYSITQSALLDNIWKDGVRCSSVTMNMIDMQRRLAGLGALDGHVIT